MRRTPIDSYAELPHPELPPRELPIRRPHSYEAADAAQLARDGAIPVPKPIPVVSRTRAPRDPMNATPVAKPRPVIGGVVRRSPLLGNRNTLLGRMNPRRKY